MKVHHGKQCHIIKNKTTKGLQINQLTLGFLNNGYNFLYNLLMLYKDLQRISTCMEDTEEE